MKTILITGGVKVILKTYFNGVIYFAAESHVDNLIKNQNAFVKIYVFGTFNLLDIAIFFYETRY